ncbi:Kinesin-like protein Klp98A [Gryllus bimaculatus]|nr:Kinesin-like protein Klp98A [Gryllus bimaculatus]
MTSKFHLVDLAGTETPTPPKIATGERFKERVNINKGLLASVNVISALGDESQKGYISYRDSRLRRFANKEHSLTRMITCVSPAYYNLEETLSTLRYAVRARRIRNKPVNYDPKAALFAKLKHDQKAQFLLMNLDRNLQCPEKHKAT